MAATVVVKVGRSHSDVLHSLARVPRNSDIVGI